jgi:hypothetical protein
MPVEVMLVCGLLLSDPIQESETTRIRSLESIVRRCSPVTLDKIDSRLGPPGWEDIIDYQVGVAEEQSSAYTRTRN